MIIYKYKVPKWKLSSQGVFILTTADKEGDHGGHGTDKEAQKRPENGVYDSTVILHLVNNDLRRLVRVVKARELFGRPPVLLFEPP